MNLGIAEPGMSTSRLCERAYYFLKTQSGTFEVKSHGRQPEADELAFTWPRGWIGSPFRSGFPELAGPTV